MTYPYYYSSEPWVTRYSAATHLDLTWMSDWSLLLVFVGLKLFQDMPQLTVNLPFPTWKWSWLLTVFSEDPQKQQIIDIRL